jgi:trehalose 6-phosphate phosphatase
MVYLLENWGMVQQRLRSAKAIALFLDFDGTLAPLRPRPDDAHLPPATRTVLERLSRRPRLQMIVVSGRRQADVCARIAIPGVRCLGIYGWENGTSPKINPVDAQMLRIARQELAARLDKGEGPWIEDKGATFALHYRGSTRNAIREAHSALQQVHQRFNHWLKVIEGNHVWEVIPRELKGKGDAVRMCMRRLKRCALPIYLGDDTADESAFAVLPQGITVCVGPAFPTRAQFRVRNPAEVRRVLEKLDQEVS